MDRTSWDVRNLLEVFSREFTHKDFCLAHLFTDIKFEGGILGLAYVGSPRRCFRKRLGLIRRFRIHHGSL